MSTLQHPSEVETRRELYAERHRELMQELAANPPAIDNFDFDPTQVPVIRMGILGIVMFLGVGIAAFLGTRLGDYQKDFVDKPRPELHQATLPVINEGGRRRPRVEGEQSYAVMVPSRMEIHSLQGIYLKVKLSEEQFKQWEPQILEELFFPPKEIELSDEQLRLLLKKNETQLAPPPSK